MRDPIQKLLFLFISFLFSSQLLAADLTVYTYDSFDSDWGPGPIVFKKFEKECGCKLKVVASGDAGSTLNRLIMERSNPQADVFLGINNSQLQKAYRFDLFQSYKPTKADKITKRSIMDSEFRVIPFDYGYLAFVYDSEKIKNPPKSLEDLLDKRFRGKIVIEDPRTSSPGLSMLHWTISEFGEKGYLDYWKKLQPNLMAVTNGWSAAYGMFTKGETSIVLSYATSPAYHLEYDKTERYRSAIFPKGHYQQTEGVAILKSTKNLKLAQKFVDFVISEKFQKEIPLTNWMYPAVQYGKLPASYRVAPMPNKATELDRTLVARKNKKWLKAWTRTLAD